MVAWMAVIFWVSGLSIRLPTPGMIYVLWDDKFQHTAAYAILAGLVWRALGGSVGGWFRAAIAILIAAGYGAFDECHQSFIPGRECSFSDWNCDAAGAALAGVVLGVLSARMGGGLRGKERGRGEDL